MTLHIATSQTTLSFANSPRSSRTRTPVAGTTKRRARPNEFTSNEVMAPYRRVDGARVVHDDFAPLQGIEPLSKSSPPGTSETLLGSTIGTLAIRTTNVPTVDFRKR